MHYRKAENNDLADLVALQNQNSAAVNPGLDRSDGVLASTFTAENFAAINNDLAIAVCVDENPHRLLGFVCSSNPAFNSSFGLPAAMMARFDQASFDGKPLSQWHCAIAGPVCVARESRGQGVFEALYGNLWTLLPEQYDLAVALVNTSNPRSLAAHKKIGMTVVDQFLYNATNYNTIAMKIR